MFECLQRLFCISFILIFSYIFMCIKINTYVKLWYEVFYGWSQFQKSAIWRKRSNGSMLDLRFKRFNKYISYSHHHRGTLKQSPFWLFTIERDFPGGETQAKSQGSREILRAEGMDFPILPEFWWSKDILSIFLQGKKNQILPCGQEGIDT